MENYREISEIKEELPEEESKEKKPRKPRTASETKEVKKPKPRVVEMMIRLVSWPPDESKLISNEVILRWGCNKVFFNGKCHLYQYQSPRFLI